MREEMLVCEMLIAHGRCSTMAAANARTVLVSKLGVIDKWSDKQLLALIEQASVVAMSGAGQCSDFIDDELQVFRNVSRLNELAITGSGASSLWLELGLEAFLFASDDKSISPLLLAGVHIAVAAGDGFQSLSMS